MAWAVLTYSGMVDRLSSAELDSLLTDSPAPEDKVTSILSQVAQEVTSYVNTGRRKRGLPAVVNTGRSVPSGAQRHAYALARRELTDAFPSLSSYNGDDRKAAVSDAVAYLEKLAKNEIDADDEGASSFASSSTSSFEFGGNATMNFIGTP